MSVPAISVIGWSGSGKTTLLRSLLPELKGRGMRVLAIKHSPHAHRLQLRGSDTEGLEKSGASAVAFGTPEGLQLTFPGEGDVLIPRWLERLEGEFDLALIEGWKSGPFPKIEVWQKRQGPCLAESVQGVRALVSDDPPPLPVRHFKCSEISGLALFILQLARETPSPSPDSR